MRNKRRRRKQKYIYIYLLPLKNHFLAVMLIVDFEIQTLLKSIHLI